MKAFPRADPPARKNKAAKSDDRIGQRIDAIYMLDQTIDELETRVRQLKQKRETQAADCLEKLQDQATDGAKGNLAIANVKKTRHPTIKDRAKLDKYILKTKNVHLLQNRVTSSVYFELLEEGEKVPGVEVFDKVSLSITKRRK